jgi:hypothetical protein
MTQTVIWSPTERLLWPISFFLIFTGGMRYLKMANKSTNKDGRRILLGIAFYLIIYSFGQIFFYLARFYHQGAFNGQVFIGEFNEKITPVVELITIGHFIANIGIVLFILEIELALKKTKYFFTSLGVVSYVITTVPLIISPNLWELHRIGMVALSAIFLIVFLYLLKTSPEFQNISLSMIAGYSIVLIGGGLHYLEALEMNLYPIELFSTVWIIGTLLYLLPVYVNIDKIQKTSPKFFWVLFITVEIIAIILSIAFYVFTQLLLYLTSIFLFILLILSMVYIFKQGKEPIQEPMKDQEGHVDFMKMFSRPESLTEEEVSISKEKKICLVCKGKVIGISFICRECEAFYCQKCYQALTQLENACWACDNALDETKSVKLPEKEEGELVVEEDVSKKKPRN